MAEDADKELIGLVDTLTGGQVSVPVEPAKLHSNVIREILLADTEAIEITVPRLPSCEPTDEKDSPSSFGFLDQVLRPFLSDKDLQRLEWTGKDFPTHGTWGRLHERFYDSVIKTADDATLACYLETSNYLDVNVLTCYLAHEYAARLIERKGGESMDVIKRMRDLYSAYINETFIEVNTKNPWYVVRLLVPFVPNLGFVQNEITPEFIDRNTESFNRRRPWVLDLLSSYVDLSRNNNFTPDHFLSMLDGTPFLVNQTFEWISKNMDRFVRNIADWKKFSSHIRFASVEEFLGSLDDKRFRWDWGGLSLNPTILPVVEAYPTEFKWDWDQVSRNPELSQSYILENWKRFQFNWDLVSQHPCLSWDFVVKHKLIIDWAWDKIIRNPAIV